MYKAKIFTGDSLTAAELFNIWSEENPEVEIINFKYKTTECKVHSITILYKEKTHISNSHDKDITLGNLINIIKSHPCCTILTNMNVVIFTNTANSDNESIDNIKGPLLNSIVDSIEINEDTGRLIIKLKD